MKKLLVLILLPICIFASLEFTLRDGEVIRGDLICETKGNLTLKSGNGTISVFKKSIRLYKEQDITGLREFILGDSLILRNKNEIFFIIETIDDARIKLREILPDGSEMLIGEKSGVVGDTLKFFVPDGKYYEAVEYTRADTAKYYGFGTNFDIKTKCDKFAKTEISLRGFAGERIPILRGNEQRFKKDGD